MDTCLQGRTAIITGGSSGLGRATALRFAGAGARVVVADRNDLGVQDEINTQRGPETAIFVSCDVTDEDQIVQLVEKAVAFGRGRLDILCTFAGIAAEFECTTSPRCHEMETSLFDKGMAVNCRGVWLCCKYALKQMMSQEPLPPNVRGDRTRGWIVNVASICGVIACNNTPAYTTSKHAVVGLTKQLALDYAPEKIHVNAIGPGWIKSPMTVPALGTQEMADAAAAKHPWNTLGLPEDIADVALFLCSPQSAWVTGHTLMADGGYSIQ